MTPALANSVAPYFTNNQIFPVDHHAEVSQRLVEAAHANDMDTAYECFMDPMVDVNFIGTVSFKCKKTEIVLHDQSAHEVRVEYEEFRTDVSALFLAAHAGNMILVRKLLGAGANVNQKLFKGYAITAAVREGHTDIVDVLINAGACQQACEEALLEASYTGQPRISELLMGSQLIQRHVAVHALVVACCRGFVDVVDALVKCGVDVNATYRVLLQSSKPSLHINVDCSALVAAVVNRQTSVVRLLLQAGAKVDTKAKLGAWSWDESTGDEFRVGAGLAEPYSVIWCLIEYFEATGTILHMLLQYLSVSSIAPHFGRNIIHHAILCNNEKALSVLLKNGANVECPIKTTSKVVVRPIHLAARLGFPKVLQCLVSEGCNLNSRTESGETAVMICARYKHEECMRILISAGADLGLVNSASQCVSSIAESSQWNPGFQKVVLDVIRAGKTPHSSDAMIFSPLMVATRANDTKALNGLIRSGTNLDETNIDGYTTAMIAANKGHKEAFSLLIQAGANIKVRNKHGDTAISLAQSNCNSKVCEKIMQDHKLEDRCNDSVGINALPNVIMDEKTYENCPLIAKCHDNSVLDSDGNIPLSLAATADGGKEESKIASAGHATEASVTTENKSGNHDKEVMLDRLARELVLKGTIVKKHTKCGKGTHHKKVLRMVESTGVLCWGRSSKRNVICRCAEVGPRTTFRWNRRRKFDADEPGLFHVVTTKNKELHFVCGGGNEMAQLWVRGIKLVTTEAIFGKTSREV